MLDLIDALGALLRGPLALDDTAERPFEWIPETLYVWEDASSHNPVETGPVVRENFVIMAAVTVRTDEEAAGERKRETTEALYAHRDRMLDLIRTFSTSDVWADGHIEGASVPDYLRQLEQRGIAIRISGYRIIGG